MLVFTIGESEAIILGYFWQMKTNLVPEPLLTRKVPIIIINSIE